MLIDFFYLLRDYGVDVSPTEWLALMEGLEAGLHHASLTDFYSLCRSILCKSETEYDKFETAFQDYFHAVLFAPNGAPRTDLPDGAWDWMQPAAPQASITQEMRSWGRDERRQETQTQQQAQDSGYRFMEVQILPALSGGEGFRTAPIQVKGRPPVAAALRAPKWEFRDFREDNLLSIRQFQMAFRRLCIHSNQFGQEEELDIRRTIHDTCQKGGMLQVRYQKPRRNKVKVLLLMDSGGTMTPYSSLCSRLFQAASRSNRFRDLKIYYFHNCLDEYLYTNPTLRLKYEVSTRKELEKLDKEYRVIIVGDGTMDVNELIWPPREVTRNNKGYSGRDWLEYLLERFHSAVWLTPVLRERGTVMGTWGESYDIITDLFPMFPLTVEGLEQAMKQLMVKG